MNEFCLFTVLEDNRIAQLARVPVTVTEDGNLKLLLRNDSQLMLTERRIDCRHKCWKALQDRAA